MLASFSEPIDVGERQRKGEMEGVKERERKKQNTTFLQSFLLMAYAKQGLLLL